MKLFVGIDGCPRGWFFVAIDDILDACIAAVTASHSENGLATVPEKPEHDKHGLPMEIVYYALV